MFLTFFGRLFHLSCKNQYLRFRRTRNDRKTLCFWMLFVKIDENRCTVVQNRPRRPSARPLTPVVRPSVRPFVSRPSARPRRDRKTQCFLKFCVKIDENRCTVVQKRPCRPSSRPRAPVARPSARPPWLGSAKPLYIELPIDRHGQIGFGR